jgi:hypothetical protein
MILNKIRDYNQNIAERQQKREAMRAGFQAGCNALLSQACEEIFQPLAQFGLVEGESGPGWLKVSLELPELIQFKIEAPKLLGGSFTVAITHGTGRDGRGYGNNTAFQKLDHLEQIVFNTIKNCTGLKGYGL